MGYTHYFSTQGRRKIDPASKSVQERFANWSSDVQKLLEALPQDIKICGPDGDGKPIIDTHNVAFNGSGNLGHEPFDFALPGLDQIGDPAYTYEGRDFTNTGFCKTAQKPYDLLVCAALIRLDLYFNKEIEIESDGHRHEWGAAWLLCEKVFGAAVVPEGVVESLAEYFV